MRHDSRVNSASFSPDGTRVVTASWDNTARLWDVATGKPLAQPMRHEGNVNSASFNADGTRVVTASDDKTARVWDVAVPWDGRLLAYLDELAADQQLGEGGVLEPLPIGVAERLAVMRAAYSADGRGINWWITNPADRTISPLSTMRMTEWSQERTDENTPESLQAAWEADPNNGLCLARRARLFALQDPPDAIDAQVYLYAAMHRLPKDPEVAWRRVAVLALLGKAAEAAEVAGHCPEPPAGDLWAGEAKWEACVLLGRHADAAAARQKTEGLAKGRESWIRQSVSRCFEEVEAHVKHPATARSTGPETRLATTQPTQ